MSSLPLLGHDHNDIGAEENGGDHAHRGDEVDVVAVAGAALGALAGFGASAGGLTRGALRGGFFRSFG